MGAGVPAITEYNNTGKMTLTTWNATTKKIVGPTGVVPLTADWFGAIKLDFATYTGDPNIFPSDPNAWVYLKSTFDNAHLFFAEPLDSSTLVKLGFTKFPNSVELIDGNIPTEFVLKQNYPNPFNPETKIEFSLPKTEFVNISVYDVVGNLITHLFRGEKQAGTYRISFNGENLSSGVYLLQMNAGSLNKVIKMVLTR